MIGADAHNKAKSSLTNSAQSSANRATSKCPSPASPKSSILEKVRHRRAPLPAR